MSGDKDHDSHRAGVLVGAGTGLLLLACCALPLLICCGLPLLAAGGALAGIGGFLGNPWLIGAGIAVGVGDGHAVTTEGHLEDGVTAGVDKPQVGLSARASFEGPVRLSSSSSGVP
ncbi:hypothetical protein J2S67_001275 [Pseudoglutamicibacter albus]|uniref:Uncharacterized protein n=1 Tax=Pseudoglutamicibacter albus TaxID=98671 RepID=A0ABU1Z070_9MICC|nr:hypothetical protein [Pseudoglutamicibacter albus]MDR7294007.1 hypothetical protein [Pseudoglutamicibacter albus]